MNDENQTQKMHEGKRKTNNMVFCDKVKVNDRESKPNPYCTFTNFGLTYMIPGYACTIASGMQREISTNTS